MSASMYIFPSMTSKVHLSMSSTCHSMAHKCKSVSMSSACLSSMTLREIILVCQSACTYSLPGPQSLRIYVCISFHVHQHVCMSFTWNEWKHKWTFYTTFIFLQMISLTCYLFILLSVCYWLHLLAFSTVQVKIILTAIKLRVIKHDKSAFVSS